MIAEFSSVSLLGLAGPRQSGKTTAAMLLQRDHGFIPLAFADPIREAVLELFPCWDAQHFEAPSKDTVCGIYQITPRAALRAFGEHARGLCPLAYIEAMARRVEAIAVSAGATGARVVIHDVRLPAEAEWIRGLGGRIVHVKCPGVEWSGEHVTEVGPGVGPHDLSLPNPSPRNLVVYRSLIRSLVGVADGCLQ